MDRRGFLKGMAGILASGFAPAVVGSGILMPVKTIWKPDRPIFIGIDWGREDASSTPQSWNELQSFINEHKKQENFFAGIQWENYFIEKMTGPEGSNFPIIRLDK